ncbi:MAG TPA: hypothetical protein VJ812_12640 [Gemmatimonadaceae bacterium]|jgi:hypothetical protein|nr:hypothetical protein [Gemmatimonadaceae bacterium]
MDQRREELAKMLERIREQGMPRRDRPAHPDVEKKRTEHGWNLQVQPGDFAPGDEWERIRERVARAAESDSQPIPPPKRVPKWLLFLTATLGVVLILAVLFVTFQR